MENPSENLSRDQGMAQSVSVSVGGQFGTLTLVAHFTHYNLLFIFFKSDPMIIKGDFAQNLSHDASFEG